MDLDIELLFPDAKIHSRSAWRRIYWIWIEDPAACDVIRRTLVYQEKLAHETVAHCGDSLALLRQDSIHSHPAPIVRWLFPRRSRDFHREAAPDRLHPASACGCHVVPPWRSHPPLVASRALGADIQVA